MWTSGRAGDDGPFAGKGDAGDDLGGRCGRAEDGVILCHSSPRLGRPWGGVKVALGRCVVGARQGGKMRLQLLYLLALVDEISNFGLCR